MSKKSVLDKINPMLTLQKRKKEIEELNNESKNAIERIQNLNLDPDFYDLKENQELSTLGLGEKKKLEPLLKLLVEWINAELADSRVIVKDIQEDLYDGHILELLIEKLTGRKLSSSKETKLNLTESTQKQNLKQILDFINSTLNIQQSSMSKWTVENIYAKDIISILHLLVAIVKHFKVPINLPDNVSVNVVVVVKKGKTLEKKTIVEQITDNEALESKRDRDAFDTLLEHAPEKLTLVKNSFMTFLNKWLKKIDFQVTNIDTEVCIRADPTDKNPFLNLISKKLNDGVKLIYLMGILGNYYIPEYSYHSNPKSYEEKVDNIRLLFDLMEDVKLAVPVCKPEDIVNGDLKSTLRVVYNLFTKYKDSN